MGDIYRINDDRGNKRFLIKALTASVSTNIYKLLTNIVIKLYTTAEDPETAPSTMLPILNNCNTDHGNQETHSPPIVAKREIADHRNDLSKHRVFPPNGRVQSHDQLRLPVAAAATKRDDKMRHDDNRPVHRRTTHPHLPMEQEEPTRASIFPGACPTARYTLFRRVLSALRSMCQSYATHSCPKVIRAGRYSTRPHRRENRRQLDRPGRF